MNGMLTNLLQVRLRSCPYHHMIFHTPPEITLRDNEKLTFNIQMFQIMTAFQSIQKLAWIYCFIMTIVI